MRVGIMRRFKVWLAWKLLGEPEEVNREVEYIYAEIWPKHVDTEARTKMVINEAVLRIVANREREERKDQP